MKRKSLIIGLIKIWSVVEAIDCIVFTYNTIELGEVKGESHKPRKG